MNPIRPNIEREFRDAVSSLQDEYGRRLTQIESDTIRWELEFEADYPDEYVAFQSVPCIVEDERRLVRKVLGHSSAYSDIARLMAGMSEADRRKTRIHHFESQP